MTRGTVIELKRSQSVPELYCRCSKLLENKKKKDEKRRTRICSEIAKNQKGFPLVKRFRNILACTYAFQRFTCVQQLGNFRLPDDNYLSQIFDDYPDVHNSSLLTRHLHETVYNYVRDNRFMRKENSRSYVEKN